MPVLAGQCKCGRFLNGINTGLKAIHFWVAARKWRSGTAVGKIEHKIARKVVATFLRVSATFNGGWSWRGNSLRLTPRQAWHSWKSMTFKEHLINKFHKQALPKFYLALIANWCGSSLFRNDKQLSSHWLPSRTSTYRQIYQLRSFNLLFIYLHYSSNCLSSFCTSKKVI